MSPVAVLMNIISRLESNQGCLSIEKAAPERGGLPEDKKGHWTCGLSLVVYELWSPTRKMCGTVASYQSTIPSMKLFI